jgi:AraC-like DNA-binding protein/mannose-6-phosphate isomerase-like protein (cupin superfamily)
MPAPCAILARRGISFLADSRRSRAAILGFVRDTHEALFQPFPMLVGRRAQVWRHQPSFRRPRHFHAEPELNLVIAGSARLALGDRRIGVSRGDLLLFHPGQDHELLEASDDLRLYVVALRPDLAERARVLVACPVSEKITLEPERLAALDERLAAMASVSDCGVVEEQLAGLFVELAPRARPAHVLSRRAIEALRVERACSAQQISERLRANPSQLSRVFHRDFGVTLAEYRARARLMDFVRLVDAGERMSHAALNADFGSYAQCHRVFRRALGCSPKDYFAGARRAVDAAVR